MGCWLQMLRFAEKENASTVFPPFYKDVSVRELSMVKIALSHNRGQLFLSFLSSLYCTAFSSFDEDWVSAKPKKSSPQLFRSLGTLGRKQPFSQRKCLIRPVSGRAETPERSLHFINNFKVLASNSLSTLFQPISFPFVSLVSRNYSFYLFQIKEGQ